MSLNINALMIILMSAVLVNNFVLIQFLGICPFLGVSRQLKSAVGMSFAVIFVMMLATVVTWPVTNFLLLPNGLGFAQTIVFVLAIAALVQLVEIVLKKAVPALYDVLGVFLPLMATNCAILAVVLLNINDQLNFVEAMVNSFGAGLGFLLAMVLFAGIRAHIENADPPECMKGLPIALFSAAILALAFFGFTGVAENLFG